MAESPTHRDGISRRAMIRASAVAGAAAWTAPVIIDSLSSPAAAASGAPIPCSWFYLVFTKPSDSIVYWTGSNGNACNTLSTNNAGTYCKVCNGTSYTILDGGQGNLTFGTTCGGTQTAATAAGASCSDFIQINGATVTAVNGATILAAFSHPSSSLSCACPGANAAGNSIAVCGSSAGGGTCDVHP
jgi:hypothetical protein